MPPRCHLLPLTLLLLASTGLATPAAAQLRGSVGSAPPVEGSVSAPSTPLTAQGTLPTLEDETKAQEARRKNRNASRETLSSPNPILNQNTRAQVIRPVRNAALLRRPANKAVSTRSMPGPAGAAPQAGALPQVIAPGLTAPPLVKRKKGAEDDPYAPLGLRLGGLTILPSVDLSAGYDTNPQRTASQAKPKGSRLLQIAPALSVTSDWSQHQVQVDLRGSYNDYLDVRDANRPSLNGVVSFRGDVSRDATLNLQLREVIESERPGSINLPSSVKGRLLYFDTGLSLGWTQKFGYAALTATGTADRWTYQDGTTRAGAAFSQKDRNYNAYGAKLRGAYELTPGIAPYIEVGVDTRVYDSKLDVAGYERSSNGLQGKLGSTFELTRTLTGDVSAGYGTRHYADSRLRSLNGPLLDASLIWLASPLTKVTLKAATTFTETVQPGSPGALSHSGSVEVAHDLLRNLTLTGSLAYARSSYLGLNRTEDSITGGMKLDYKIDRNFVFRTSYAYERAISSTPASGYTAHTFLAGLRIQQ